MSDTIERQILAVDDELSNLITADRGERQIYLSLAFDTFAALDAAGSRRRLCERSYRMCSNSVLRPSCDELPESLRARWIAWDQTYTEMLSQNPRLAIVDMLEQMSEAHDSSSWPFSREDEILEWITHGDHRHPPMTLRGDIETEEFHARLSDLRSLAGSGWAYYSISAGRVIWESPNRIGI